MRTVENQKFINIHGHRFANTFCKKNCNQDHYRNEGERNEEGETKGRESRAEERYEGVKKRSREEKGKGKGGRMKKE